MEKMLENLLRNLIASIGYTPEQIREMCERVASQVSESDARIKQMSEDLQEIRNALGITRGEETEERKLLNGSKKQ